MILAALGPPAQAAAKKKVGVSLSGMPAGPIRGAIGDVLKKHGFEASSPDLSGDSEDAIASAAKQAKLSAVIVGEVREGGKRVKLRVYSSSGDLIGEGSWSEKGGPKKLAAAVERTLWARVGGALSKARPASGGGGDRSAKAEKAEPVAEERAEPESSARTPEETPTYSRSKEAEAAPEPEREEGEEPRSSKKKSSKKKEETDDADEGSAASGPAGTALDLQVGPRFVSRSLSWVEPPAATNPGFLNPYSVAFAPSVGALLAWYPVAHVRGGWASNLGLVISAEYIPGLVSQTGDGKKYPTQSSDYWGGVRGRYALGPVTGSLTLGGGQHATIFRSGTGSMRSDLAGIPDVKYTYARAGVDLHVALPAKLSLTLGGGYRAVLGAGDQNFLLETMMFLPNAKLSALEATVGVGYRILPILEGRVGFDLRRYTITPGTNTHMVTSGTDQYTALWLGLAVVLDGAGTSSGGGGDDDDEGDKKPEKKAEKKKKVEKSEDDDE